jgi:hypothetical protein
MRYIISKLILISSTLFFFLGCQSSKIDSNPKDSTPIVTPINLAYLDEIMWSKDENVYMAFCNFGQHGSEKCKLIGVGVQVFKDGVSFKKFETILLKKSVEDGSPFDELKKFIAALRSGEPISFAHHYLEKWGYTFKPAMITRSFKEALENQRPLLGDDTLLDVYFKRSLRQFNFAVQVTWPENVRHLILKDGRFQNSKEAKIDVGD